MARRCGLVAVVVAVLCASIAAAPSAAAGSAPPRSPAVGSTAWHAALIEGASTFVPVDPDLGWFDADGEPFSVRSRITAVQFHVPYVPSGVPGGFSSAPTPVRRSVHGIDYWQVSGELSAQVVDYGGRFHFVVGPIGPDGVDHRFDGDRSHPRGQLPGALFVLRWPVKGFNGRLVDHQAAGDGGFGFPASALAALPVDPTALLDRGYALWTVSLGGTVPVGEAEGVEVVDSNPDSGTGIFWHSYPDVRTYLRAARIAADSKETAYPEDYELPLWIPGEGEVREPIGDPDFAMAVNATLQHQPELARDAIVVGKRLARQLIGSKREPWTAFLGWSGSGGTASLLGMGRVSGPIQVPPEAGAPYNGGNFNRFHDPSSGRRFDAFLSFGAGQHEIGFVGDEEWRPYVADDRYPVGAPMVWVGGDLDGLGLGLSGVVYANEVARHLPTSALSPTPIEQLVATYDLKNLPHATWDWIFANEPSKPTGDGLRYQRRGSYPEGSEASFGDGGSLLQPAFVEAAPWYLTDDYLPRFAQDIPRTTPLFLQQLENLHQLTTKGTPLPVSRVEGRLFRQLGDLEVGTPYPLVDRPCPPAVVGPSNPFGVGQATEACVAGIDQDSTLDIADEQSGEVFTARFLDEADLAQARYFVEENPLDHVVGSIEVPDVAAALGPILVTGQLAIQRRLTDEQLRAGWTTADGRMLRYRDHDAWVDAFASATRGLVRERLWDRDLGRRYVEAAARSDVLR